ncbi:MAG: cell division protein SepF, partial [Eubacteriales bacterium]|nr:cell division protein SepF [Eubacteriales bacterium]
RYSSGGGGYFDRGDDTRRNVSRSTEERLNRALPPIGQPVRTQPTGQFVPPQQPAPQYAAPQPQNPALQSVPIGNVVLYSPKNYGDVQSLIDHLRMHEPAIVEFAGIGDEDGQRILDFLSGAIYALGGSMQRINGTIFLLTPYGVSISAGGDIAKSIEERRNRR